MKYSSTCWDERSVQILLRDSTACTGQPKLPGTRANQSYLVPHHGFLDGREVLQRGEEDMTPVGSSNVFHKASKLFAQSHQDFVLILDRF